MAAPSANAAAPVPVTRLAGANRFGTAATIAEAAFPAGASTVIVATGFNFPDALAGNYLAGLDKAPILLVNVDNVPSETSAALSTLKAKNVIILGQTNAVDTNTENQLKAAGYTTSRIGGATRLETMQMIDEAPNATTIGTVGGKKTALLARSDNFPDALGGGPVAYAKNFPVILTATASLSPQAQDVITKDGIQQVIILGGPLAVSAATESAANAAGAATLFRANGVDRSDTSRLLAEYELSNLGFVNTSYGIASGDQNFTGADALSSGPFSGMIPQPTLVTNSAGDPGKLPQFGAAHNATETKCYAFGGPIPLPDSDVNAVCNATQQSGAATLNQSSAQPGTTVGGTITNPGNVSSLAVSGCGLSSNVPFNSSTGAFTVTIPSGQPAGSCTLTFTATNTNGTTQTTAIPFTVNAPTQQTVRPQLVSASILSTVTALNSTPTSPQGTTVQYVFSHAVTSASATGFVVYHAGNTTNAVSATTATIQSSNPATVNVLFPTLNTATLASDLSLAAVDGGGGPPNGAAVDTNAGALPTPATGPAVTDVNGLQNPTGAAAIGTAGTNTLTAGVTNAPDLESVSATRTGSTANTTAVDFTFDSATTVVNTAGFHLLLSDNAIINCTASTSTTTPSGGTVAGGSGTTTITALCPNDPAALATTIAAGSIARGWVDQNSVGSAGTTTCGANPGPATTAGTYCAPGEASDTPHLATPPTPPSPTLTGVQFVFGTSGTANPDTVIYTFDQPVAVTNATLFQEYNQDGTATSALAGTATVNSTNNTQVSVTFPNGTLASAVGAIALTGAVTGTTGSTLPNYNDELGASNPNSTSITPGKTAGPNLISVKKTATTDVFGNVTGETATYTFDKNITVSTNSPLGLKLYDADGTELVCSAVAAISSSTPMSETCTAFGAATVSQIANSTLGTVEWKVVTATTGGAPNPEGAVATS